MKKSFILLCFFAIAVFSFGCNKDESPEKMIGGEWVLVEVKSSWTQEVIKAEAIDYEEKYIFQQNGAFVKTRTGSDSDGQATGTFTVRETEPNEQKAKYYLLLTFETGKELITSCYSGEGIEEFEIYENDRLINLAGACDHAILTYQKRN